jgi:hypothetical protein
MDYNDIIVIMLLVVIIMGLGLILLKKDSTQSEHINSYLPNNLLMETRSNPKIQYPHSHPENRTNNKINNDDIDRGRIKVGKMDSSSHGIVYNSSDTNDFHPTIGINDRLANIKNKKNKNFVMLKNKRNSPEDKGDIYVNNNKIHNTYDKTYNKTQDKTYNNRNNQTYNNIYSKPHNKTYNNRDDLQSLEDNTIASFNNFSDDLDSMVDKKIHDKKKKYVKNEELNKKVIIDDYSEYDNIKSLNSMDNTLSDLISIVEKDK